MKTCKKLFAVLLSLALTVTAFAGLFTFGVYADGDEYANHVTLNVADGQIRLFSDHYEQNGESHAGFLCEDTLYTITGAVGRGDTVLRVLQVAEDDRSVTFHLVFKDLYVYPETWCSSIYFVGQPSGEEEDAVPLMTVDLRFEGRNYIAGYNHPAFNGGNAILNISAAPDSFTTLSAEYNETNFAVGANLSLRKIGEYDVRVNGEAADFEAGKTAKPIVITGRDSSAIVKTQIDALPASTDVTVSDKEVIVAARAAYSALTSEKKAMIAAEVLQHLSDDEAALAAAEKAAEPAPKSERNLTALWVVLAFVGGAGCAVWVVFRIGKKKAAADPEPQSENDV